MDNKGLRILYLRTQFNFNLTVGGSVGHTAGIINSLRKKHDVDVISNDKLVGVKGPIKIIKAFNINIALIKDVLELIYNIKLLFKLKNILKYDLIYHRYSGSSFVAARLANKYKRPLILEFNSSALWTIKNWDVRQSFVKNFIRKLFKYLYQIPVTSIIEKYNLSSATLIVVVSKVLKDNLIEAGIPGQKILVNYNGVDLDKFNPQQANLSIIEKYNLKGKYVFGFIGTFGYWHGVKELAMAIIDFYTKHPECLIDTRFLLIGDGVLMDEVKQILSESDFENNIILTRTVNQEQAPKYLSVCNAYLSPHVPNKDGSRFFGSPTKLFEYMAMGKPIIASDLEQLSAILTHKHNAYLVEPLNLIQLSDAIYYVYQNQQAAQGFGDQARESVINNYTWDKNIERLINYYNLNKSF